MPKAPKKKKSKSSGGGFSLFDESEGDSSAGEEDELPKDEVGRQKIKSQYVDLLGIRLAKLRGRVLNRERIDKNIEGVYFICNSCEKICHNLDDGLIEDETNRNNLCVPCHEAAKAPSKARGRVAKAKTTPKKPTSKPIPAKKKPAAPAKAAKAAPIKKKR